jgi:cytochrome c553
MPVQLPVPPPDPAIQHVPGSSLGFTFAQIYDVYNVPDWHPEDHPSMPSVVAHGKTPSVIGCGYCHLPNGLGKPEDASLAGLSVNYIVQQMQDFKSGARRSYDPARAAPIFMTAVANTTSRADAIVAALYFASLKLMPRIRVEEVDMAPKTELAPAGMYFAAKSGDVEPIRDRVIELPEDEQLTLRQDSRSGYVAYVPRGSIEEGRSLLTDHGRHPVSCGACHGTDLNGHGDIPPIAGRSPSYIFRQLYDFRAGTRAGPLAVQMTPVVNSLTDREMLSITVYLASLPP